MEWMPNSALPPASPFTVFFAQPDFQLLWFQPWGSWWTTELMLLCISKRPWEQRATLADRWDGEIKAELKISSSAHFSLQGLFQTKKFLTARSSPRTWPLFVCFLPPLNYIFSCERYFLSKVNFAFLMFLIMCLHYFMIGIKCFE